MQEDIIKRHMFPITLIPPKYLESWIVDLVDDYSAVNERLSVCGRKFKSVTQIIIFVIISFIKSII